MGNNLSSDTPSSSNSIKKLNPNIRWYISDKLLSEPGAASYNPFPIDVSFKIEEAYQSNQYYHSDKDDDTMIFFDYEHQEKHIMINQNDAWKQKKVIRVNLSDNNNRNPNINTKSPRISKHFNVEKISHFENFPKAFSNQLLVCPYNKIFENIEYDRSDTFLCNFIRHYILIDKNFYKFLTEDFNLTVLEKLKQSMYNMNPDISNMPQQQLNFKIFKEMLIDDFKKLQIQELDSYIQYYLKGLTKDNFEMTMIKMFNEDGILYKMVLNFIKKKTYKNNTELILYYLSWLYSINQLKITSLTEKMYLYPKKLFLDVFEPNTYYYLNEGLICSKKNSNDLPEEKQKIEIIYKNNSISIQKYPFLCVIPYENGKVYNLYNEEEIILPHNSVLKCTEVNDDCIRFEIVLDIISNQIPYMKDIDKKLLYIYDDISVITCTYLFFERDIYPNVKYAKIKPKNVKYISKFSTFGNTLESLDCYGADLSFDNLSILLNVFTNKCNLKFLDLSGNDINEKGLSEFNKFLPNLSHTLETLNLSFNAINDEAISKINFAFLPNLKNLILKENYINKAGAKYLAENLKNIRKLVVFDLYDNTFGDEGIISISKEIHHLTYLGKIDLFHCSITNEGIKEFFKAIMILSNTLQWINLKQNLFGRDDEVVDLIIQINSKFHLSFFNYEQNQLVDTELYKIEQSKAVSSPQKVVDNDSSSTILRKKRKEAKQRRHFNNSPNINITSLSSFKYLLNHLNDYSEYIQSINFSEYDKSEDFPQMSLKHLFNSSLSLSNLVSLNLNFCSNLSTVSLNIILSTLSNFENLTELSLNSIGLNTKVDVFNNNLNQLCRIEKLSLCFNDIDELFILETIENFSYLISIKHIDLYGNLINDDAMKILCSALRVQNNLSYINLGKNEIGNKGITYLGGIFQYLTNLKWLDLSGNVFEDDAVKVFLANFAFLLGLDRFDIRNNKISQKVIDVVLNQGIPKTFMMN